MKEDDGDDDDDDDDVQVISFYFGVLTKHLVSYQCLNYKLKCVLVSWNMLLQLLNLRIVAIHASGYGLGLKWNITVR